MFAVGEEIVYGSMGVCSVEDICLMDVPGAARECYLLIPRYVPNSKIYAPVENNPVEMRRLLSKTQVETLLESLPEIQAFPIQKERAGQYDLYRCAINSADSVELAKLIKTLHERKQDILRTKKMIPIAEKELFDKAEMILYGEIASVLGIPFSGVEEYFKQRIQS